MTDELKKYLFSDRSTRVQTVYVEDAWKTGLQHQTLPVSVRTLLGELTAAAILLASNLKFDGSLVLQVQGDGPVALLVVECTADLKIRATASLREGADIPEQASMQELINQSGQGRFIVVLDPSAHNPHMQPYQGIVPLTGESIAEALEDYMLHSEQLDTRIWLHANDHRLVGLLLQKLPGQGGTPAEANVEQSWERALHLAATIQPEELRDLHPQTLIHRLFWEEELLELEGNPIQWHCPCSREKVASMLHMLGKDEVEDILRESAVVEVACNFCGKPYQFDPVDCASLFIDNPDNLQTGDKTLH